MTWLQMFLSNMKYLLLGMLFATPLLADSYWDSDGSLIIIESSEPTHISIDGSGEIQMDTEVSDSEPTFVYGTDKLTVCQPTGQGAICY